MLRMQLFCGIRRMSGFLQSAKFSGTTNVLGTPKPASAKLTLRSLLSKDKGREVSKVHAVVALVRRHRR
jgi:hypothetical protein